MKLADLKTHPAAEIFPMMTEAELDELQEDIATNGMQTPIDVFEGLVIDGRNRAVVCQRLGIEPDVIEHDEMPDPEGFVYSRNLFRRHLTKGKRALLANKYKDKLVQKHLQQELESAIEEQLDSDSSNLKKPVDSTAEAANALGVSEGTLHAAGVVLKHGSDELIAAVESDQVAVSTAASIAKNFPQDEQLAIATAPKASAAKGETSETDKPKEHKCLSPWKKHWMGVPMKLRAKVIDYLIQVDRQTMIDRVVADQICRETIVDMLTPVDEDCYETNGICF
jgi:hypothetical protein